MRTNEHELTDIRLSSRSLGIRLWDPLRGNPAFQKLCEEKQP
jgi:hypothetical protein